MIIQRHSLLWHTQPGRTHWLRTRRLVIDSTIHEQLQSYFDCQILYSFFNSTTNNFSVIHYTRSRLDRSVELHANAFWEDDVIMNLRSCKWVQRVSHPDHHSTSCSIQLYSCSLCFHNTHLKYKMLIVHVSLDYNYLSRSSYWKAVTYWSSTLLSNLLLIIHNKVIAYYVLIMCMLLLLSYYQE